MANSGSRKQITFDLCQEALKKYYPHSLTQAYYDIRRFMESHGFEHRQSSAYVSLAKMMTLDVVSLAEQLAMALPWLSRCVNEIDVANIGAVSYTHLDVYKRQSKYRYHLRLFPDKQKFYIFCYQTDRMREGRPAPDHNYLYRGKTKRRSGKGERE